jgi:integrase
MPSTRSSYQDGSLERVSRAKGRHVWVYRWRELQPDGSRVQKKKVVGTLKEYPKLADAKQAVSNLRAEINAPTPKAGRTTVLDAWGHFQEHELRDPEINRSQSTIDNYLDLFRCHIIPKWGAVALDDIKAVAVEEWLRSLTQVTPAWRRVKEGTAAPKPTAKLAPGSKAKIKSRLHTLFAHAKRHELCDKNPIEDVRQGSKRLRKPAILALEEVRGIMYQVTSQAIRVAILVAAVTGFRRSEIRGLKWRDIDFVGWTITPVRGSIRRHLSNLKNDASGATVPIPEALVVALQQWRTECLYPGDEDWIFASVQRAGKSPLWFDAALQRQLRPAAIRAGITKHVGWHTFRHSLATLLVKKREGIKVVQELMRHADSRTTLDIYSQSDDEDKRAAQKHVSGLFVGEQAS